VKTDNKKNKKERSRKRNRSTP